MIATPTQSPESYKDLADLVEYFFPTGSLEEDDDGQLVIHTRLKWDMETGASLKHIDPDE